MTLSPLAPGTPAGHVQLTPWGPSEKNSYRLNVNQKLSQRVVDLEGRMSVLHQIKEDEALLDSLATLNTTRAGQNDIICPWLGTSTPGKPAVSSVPV
ncbi:hypothetical protein DPEC_G00282970 [Dallia pectoralis]|uniref:Uncharacterized protein n=1 Tax=Dallia pectoralis TaxID=75939 RepID=A0ACC2FJ18_DALPE|nr:hypothetical protein DPEC_G00282970 [Dallia pectoralis]